MNRKTNIMRNRAFTQDRVRSSFITALFLYLLITGQACAQSIQPQSVSKVPFITPVMKVSNLKDEANPMKIDELKVDIRVIGQIAVTTLEISYFNTNDRTLEGEFNFPLGEGQTISRFALDINGKMREGVVVEKEEGRKTFEAIARRQVDPGLLEKTEGNNFRARVFPLPAKGYRRIIVAYEQELIDKDKGYLYQLPLKIDDIIRNFSIHLEVVKQEVKFNIEENEMGDIDLQKWNDSYVADIKKENYRPEKQLAFVIPFKKENISYTEPFSETSDLSWFYINLKPKPLEREKSLPGKIALYWDNSNSAAKKDIEKELAVLDGYFKKIRNVQVELIPFNIEEGKSSFYNIQNGNWSELRKALTDMVYDGGTSLGKINFSKRVCDEVLLFSDGLSNFGKSLPGHSKAPVMIINSSVIANHALLSGLAQQSNGVYINLSKLSVENAVNSLSKSNYHFISASVDNGNISNLYPAVPSQFNGSFSMAGVMKGKDAIITLNFGFGNEVTYSEKVSVSAADNSRTGILRRVWAQKKLASLSIDEEANKDEITRLGKEYNIVTSNTSLIVLENLSDYLQYHIVPPKELQTEYFSQIRDEEKTKADKTKEHVEYVIGLFNERLNWYNTNYPLKPVTSKSGNADHFTSPTVVDTAVVVMDDLVENESPAFLVVEESAAFDMAAPPAPELKKEEDIKDKGGLNASIQLNAWDPQSPYIKVLQYAAKGTEYTTYLKLKAEYGDSPYFFVDASDFFVKAGQKELALRILSNLAELKLEEPNLLRILGKKLQEMDCNEDAVMVFKKVLTIKGEEAQSYRDLGLAYEANRQYQLAINTLYEIVKPEWDGRFPQIELIAVEEINNIIAKHGSQVKYSFIDFRLIKNMPLDIRAVLTWDTDNCDMDLWVTNPEGEKCDYSHNLTRIGGMISNDFTQGYGPEEFLIKKAISGNYTVEVNYYGTRSQKLLAPVTLHLTFFTNYGKQNQQKQEVVLRLENKQDVVNVGKFTFTAAK
jgi:uncharacterized protein YfaP (DUF2135 family)